MTKIMKKTLIIAITVLAFLVLAVMFAGIYKFNYLAKQPGYDVDGNPVPQAKISISNDIIYFKGATEEANYRLLLAKVAKYPEVDFKKIIVNSSGGHTVYGRKIAEFVLANNLDVEVEELCFSSCANYIFPAGKIKYIQENAFVGWHGSEFQGLLLKKQGQTFEAYQKEAIKKALALAGYTGTEVLEREYKQSMKDLMDEWLFFKKVKSSIAIALQAVDKLTDDLPYNGWMYSIEDMQKFGLHDIVYLGKEGEYPNPQQKYRERLLTEVYDAKKVKKIEALVAAYVDKQSSL